ncbi:hypothetical protein Y032_0074g897 [Ancylostoma ceylanicum]|uniref:Uncharacterized protein n=1 Tax=Ancylostoma ceylanicum TaxID=53326 RepID=A0A016TVY5_9BILA|nr:hypothetical protein Y032_0074g897 [Ancylostoma ceylanicum]
MNSFHLKEEPELSTGVNKLRKKGFTVIPMDGFFWGSQPCNEIAESNKTLEWSRACHLVLNKIDNKYDVATLDVFESEGASTKEESALDDVNDMVNPPRILFRENGEVKIDYDAGTSHGRTQPENSTREQKSHRGGMELENKSFKSIQPSSISASTAKLEDKESGKKKQNLKSARSNKVKELRKVEHSCEYYDTQCDPNIVQDLFFTAPESFDDINKLNSANSPRRLRKSIFR